MLLLGVFGYFWVPKLTALRSVAVSAGYSTMPLPSGVHGDGIRPTMRALLSKGSLTYPCIVKGLQGSLIGFLRKS